MRLQHAPRHEGLCRSGALFALFLFFNASVVLAHLEESHWPAKPHRHHRLKGAIESRSGVASGNLRTSAMAVQDYSRLDWVAPEFLAALRNNAALRNSQSPPLATVRSLAQYYGAMKPFSFTEKPAWIIPNGDVHEYVSFAPYWWPVSTSDGLGAKAPSYCAKPDTASDARLVWKNCPYERRDGQVNPDTTMYGDAATFRNVSGGAFFNAISYALTGDESYASSMARMVRTAFLDSDTAVRPRVRFGQIVRGPKRNGSQNDWSTGTFRGLIEWRHLVKLANAVVIMRAAEPCSSWTKADDDGIRAWAGQYVKWMLSDPISLQIKTNTAGLNNMVSFWYSQLIALQLLQADSNKAKAYASEYFKGPFTKLITTNGDQPTETSRTRPVHYRAFSLEAMIVNARMAAWAGDASFWNAKTKAGSTMNTAVKYALEKASGAAQADRAELAALVSVAINIYGDFSDGRYKRYLSDDGATADPQHAMLWRLFNSREALTYA